MPCSSYTTNFLQCFSYTFTCDSWTDNLYAQPFNCLQFCASHCFLTSRWYIYIYICIVVFSIINAFSCIVPLCIISFLNVHRAKTMDDPTLHITPAWACTVRQLWHLLEAVLSNEWLASFIYNFYSLHMSLYCFVCCCQVTWPTLIKARLKFIFVPLLEYRRRYGCLVFGVGRLSYYPTSIINWQTWILFKNVVGNC